MSILVVFLVMAVSLSPWSIHADAATRDADELPAGVILEAGQIDSSTVEAGASVAVVYGLGYRDPVSGEWPRLTTARGTVHAVDGQRLLLALEGRDSLQRIDLERIQTLVLAGSPSLGLTDRDSTVADGSREEPIRALADSGRVEFQVVPQTVQDDSLRTPAGGSNREEHIKTLAGSDLRIAKKLGIGALWGIVPSYASGLLLTLATGNTEGFGAGIVLQFTVALGYPLGVAAGVSRVDPYDRFIHSLAGSGVGLLANFYVPRTNTYQFSAFDWDVIWNWFVCPLIGATIASELGRDPNESRRFSIDVVPSPRALSAVAKLRF